VLYNFDLFVEFESPRAATLAVLDDADKKSLAG
jgi:hypothetical protein